jgi:orotate phosphoribosyltransferase
MAESETSRMVASALLDAGAVTLTPNEPVTFKSGLRSPVYIDSRRLIFHPRPWHVVIEAFETKLGDAGTAPDVIAGVEAAGIPHSSSLAYSKRLPCVFVRKMPKGHGLERRIEGGDVAGHRVVLVEDMVTTGGSSLSAVEALRHGGAVVDECLAVITYGFAEMAEAFEAANVQLHVLTTFSMVVDEAMTAGRMDERGASLVRGWLADPHGWEPA